MNRAGVLAQQSLAMLLFASVAARGQSVNAALSSVKVRPTDAVATNPTATIKAAKNEFEGFQIVVTAPSGGLGSVSLNMPITLTLDGGTATIPSSEIRAYREVFSHFNTASTLDGASGDWPDALAPYQDDGMAVCQGSGFTLCPDSGDRRTGAFPFNIPVNQNGVIWIDVHVPLNQQPGLYRGTVTVTNGGSAIGQIAVNLTVRPFSIPSKSSLPSLFDIAIDQVCRAHGDVSGNYCPGVSDFHVWSNLYARFFLDHRITLTLHDGLSGSTNYSGVFATYASDYGSLINGTDAYTRLPNAALTTLKYPWWSYTDGQSTAQAKFLGWANGASGQGWFGLNLFYAQTGSPGHYADEPGSNCTEWGNAIRAAQWAHSQNSGYRAMVTSGDYDDWVRCGSSSDIDVLAPVLDWVDGKTNQASNGKNLSGEYQTFLAGSSRRSAWMYQSCDQSGCNTNTSTAAVNYPTFVADNSAIQNRAEPWMHYIYQMEGGMYYYDVASTLPTAWNFGNGIWNPDTGGNGQGTLVYPGTPATVSGGSSFALGGSTHIPVASIRLKMLRDGMEDYEYLLQCEAVTHSRTTALSIAQNVFPMQGTDVNGNPHGSMYDVNNYNNSNQTDPKTLAGVLENARESLANCITNGNNFTVSVTPAGFGTGTVTSTPPGINCGTGGTTCSYAFPSNSQVVLNATADTGSTFSGYSGDCTGTSCTLTMNASKSVTATFAKPCNSSDCFNRPDSADLGSNWNTYTPALQITSGQATNTDLNTKAAQWLTSMGPDQDIAVDCKVTGPGSNCGLMGRWSDANNLYYAYLDAGLGNVDLWRVQAATATKIGSATRTMSSNRYYHLRLLVQGSAISVFFNNETTATISVTDTALPTGNYAGLHAFAGAAQSVWYADFDVKAAGTTYYTVTLTKSGNGTGTVTSSPGSINCGATCATQVVSGTSLRLDAAPDSGSSFGGFTGGCTSSTAPCTFVVSSDTTVNAAFAKNDFSIAANPASATAQQGGTATYTVTTQVTSGSAQTVTFSASGLPAGATASFNPASLTAGGSSTMTVTVSSSTAAGTYNNVSIVGTGTSTTHSTTVSLTVVPQGSIAFRAMSTYTSLSDSTMNMRLTVPSSVQANDVLIATLYVGDYSSSSLPAVGAPSGWTLVRQATHGAAGELLIYSRVATASDPGTAYSWTTTVWVGAACSMLAYSGANTGSPVVEVSAAQDNPSSGSTYSTPSVSTSTNGDLVIGTWAAYRTSGTSSWSSPSGMTQRTNFTNTNLLSMSNADATQATAGTAGPFSSTNSATLGYALTASIALRPASAPPPIAFRAAGTYSVRSSSTKSIDLVVPSSVQANDVLIANVFAGDYASGTLPVVSAPSGWTLVRQVTHGNAAILQIYSRVANSTDRGRTYSWTTDVWVGSASSLLAYVNASAVDASAAQDNPSSSATYSTPQTTTTASGDLLIATYAGYTRNGEPLSWSTPSGMSQRVFLNNSDQTSHGLLSLSNDDKVQSAAGSTGTFASTANPNQTYALTALVALKH